jgi:hypothetical protein
VNGRTLEVKPQAVRSDMACDVSIRSPQGGMVYKADNNFTIKINNNPRKVVSCNWQSSIAASDRMTAQSTSLASYAVEG